MSLSQNSRILKHKVPEGDDWWACALSEENSEEFVLKILYHLDFLGTFHLLSEGGGYAR